MASHLIMTLDEMLRVALGTTPLEHVQVTILHSFLKIVLQKLNITTCFVEVSGPEAKYLRELLLKAQNPCVHIEACPQDNLSADVNINVFEMDDEIKRLTNLVEQMETKLKKHLDCVERCKLRPAVKVKVPSTQDPIEEYDSSDCEEPCVPRDEKSLIACDLLQNQLFLRKLMRRVTVPVVNRILKFEKMIELMIDKFNQFIEAAQEEYKKVAILEELIREVKKLQRQLEEHIQQFITNMEEIQDMMDTKLDKIHIPALKKYINDRIMVVEKRLDILIKNEHCPKAPEILTDNLQCLCCTTRVCQKDKIFPVPIMADAHPQKVKKMPCFDTTYCLHRIDRLRTCGGPHTILKPDEKVLHSINLSDAFGSKKLPYDHLKKLVMFKGIHNHWYRQGTTKPEFDK